MRGPPGPPVCPFIIFARSQFMGSSSEQQHSAEYASAQVKGKWLVVFCSTQNK